MQDAVEQQIGAEGQGPLMIPYGPDPYVFGGEEHAALPQTSGAFDGVEEIDGSERDVEPRVVFPAGRQRLGHRYVERLGSLRGDRERVAGRSLAVLVQVGLRRDAMVFEALEPVNRYSMTAL